MAGEWQVVLISPEILLSHWFIQLVLKNTVFGKHVLSVTVDEAHVVLHWGGEFRKKYGMLGIIHSFLPRGVPIVAVSATLPAKLRADVLAKLQFGDDYINIDIGNDCDNVSIVVRAIHEPMNTYVDLNFVLGTNPNTPADIKKTFIYGDDININIEIEDHLDQLLPEHLQGQGLICPYNAVHDKKYLKEVMDLFKRGVIRILICTDAAGMVSAAHTVR